MPSWLAELGEAPEAETTPPPSAEAEEDVEGEAPPWLTLSAPPADEARTAVLAQESENDLEMPSWLAELSEAPTAETDSTGLVEETETGMELETPSWMAGLPETPEATEASESLVEEVGTETEQDITAWLSEFPEMVETEEVTEESEAEAELEMPAWMSKLPEAAETEAEDELTAVEPTEKEALPAWLRELPQLWIPPGFAHGFCVTSEQALFAYKCTDGYHPETELGVSWDDPDIGIAWPITDPLLSDKDRAYPRLRDVPTERLPRR
jgi:hypothetical protein